MSEMLIHKLICGKIMPTLPWDEDDDDGEDDPDDGQGWLPMPRKDWLPQGALPELENAPFEKYSDIEKLSLFDAGISPGLLKELDPAEITFLLKQASSAQRDWKMLAHAFHATEKPVHEAWLKKEKVPAFTAQMPKYRFCDGCEHHDKTRPAYIPETQHLHGSKAFFLEDEPYSLGPTGGRLLDTYPAPVYLHDALAQSIHHSLNKSIYAERNLERDAIIGCVTRLSRFRLLPFDPFELPGLYKKETQDVRRWIRSVKKEGLEATLKTLEKDQKKLLHNGFGYEFAHSVFRLAKDVDIDCCSFGEGGFGNHLDVMRTIARATDLTEAAELLFQRAEGAPAPLSEKRWDRYKIFYAAVAYQFTNLQNFLRAHP